jgi:hypothetical protein
VTLMPVAIGFAVASGLLLFWMFVLTLRAWRTLPPGTPVPVHGGLGGWDKWWPKERALFTWPVVGSLIWLITAGTMIYAAAGSPPRSKGSLAALPAVLILPMIILLVGEHYALKAAAATSGTNPPT